MAVLHRFSELWFYSCHRVCIFILLVSHSFSPSLSLYCIFLKDLKCHFDWLAAPGVKASGVNGIVYAAEPLNACSPLTINAVEGLPSPFALVIRGGCAFDEKVKNVQDAGFKAAIVYDNENSGVLVSSNLLSRSYLLLHHFLNATV